MTNDYWEILTSEDDTIKNLSIWAISHMDLVDLVDIDENWLQLRVIPDDIIPKFSEYHGFLESWKKSKNTKVTGYWGSSMYSLGIHDSTIDVVFEDSTISPVIIDLDNHQISVWVTDGGTGKNTLISGLSPINYSKMLAYPETFPKFIKIGYEYKKDINHFT